MLLFIAYCKSIFAQIESINHTSAKSTLMDADITELTSEYVKNIMIQQSSSIFQNRCSAIP